MSEFHVEVAKVQNVQKHPNADTLSVATINGYPVIFRTGDYEEGQLAVHVPVDSIVPNTPEWGFLGENKRIKAKKLRGIFSMGLLTKADPNWLEGENVQEKLGITKYEPPVSFLMNTENESDPGFIPIYTDIEGLRRWPNVLKEGEEVVLSEKLHGSNVRYLYQDGRLWVGSHTQIKKYNPDNLWWKAAIEHNLEEKLSKYPGIVFYGEVYGPVQDLKYGIKTGVGLAFFDALDTKTNKYLDFDEFVSICTDANLNVVPFLYRGPWKEDLKALSEGKSTLADHVREGFVVKPVKERQELTYHAVTRRNEKTKELTERAEVLGRVILKYVGEGYLLRKGG